MRFDAVFFDSGGTLYRADAKEPDRAVVVSMRFQRFAQALQMYTKDVDINRHRLDETLRSLEKEISKREGAGYTYLKLANAVLERMKIELGPEEAACIADAYAGPRYASWLFPNTREMMDKLSAQGLYLGIVANTAWPGFSMDRAFAGVGLLPYLKTRVYSGDWEVEKPATEIFRLAEKIAGLEGRGKRLLYVGDSLSKDVEGANRAGWSSALICSKVSSSDGKADFEYEEQLDLVKFVLG